MASYTKAAAGGADDQEEGERFNGLTVPHRAIDPTTMTHDGTMARPGMASATSAGMIAEPRPRAITKTT